MRGYLGQTLLLQQRGERVAARHGGRDLHDLDSVVGEKVIEHVRASLAVEGLWDEGGKEGGVKEQ